jgi:hypothetical protein
MIIVRWQIKRISALCAEKLLHKRLLGGWSRVLGSAGCGPSVWHEGQKDG